MIGRRGRGGKVKGNEGKERGGGDLVERWGGEVRGNERGWGNKGRREEAVMGRREEGWGEK